MKKLILILLLNLSLLFSPSPIPGTTISYGRYVSLNNHAGFFVNPDSYGFILPAIHPQQLLEYHFQRQNRPLFVIAGSALGYAITFLTTPIHGPLINLYGKFWRGAYPKDQVLYLGNFYAGFILLNILILWLSLFLFEKIFNIVVGVKAGAELPLYLLMVFIASNPVTKAFFWTVHQQMFTFFTPLLCIYILFRFRAIQDAVSLSMLIMLFLIGGMLLLVYGNFILLLPALLYGVVYQDSRKKIRWHLLAVKAGVLILAFFLPTVAWVWILNMKGVGYYNFEMKVYHHLVWIPETIHQSFELFFQQLIANTMEYILTLRTFLLWIIGSIFMIVFGNLKVEWKSRFVPDTGFVFIYFFLFYWILGAYFERLTYTLVPILICFWVVMFSGQLAKRKISILLAGLAVSWQLYVLMSYGPFY